MRLRADQEQIACQKQIWTRPRLGEKTLFYEIRAVHALAVTWSCRLQKSPFLVMMPLSFATYQPFHSHSIAST